MHSAASNRRPGHDVGMPWYHYDWALCEFVRQDFSFLFLFSLFFIFSFSLVSLISFPPSFLFYKYYSPASLIVFHSSFFVQRGDSQLYLAAEPWAARVEDECSDSIPTTTRRYGKKGDLDASLTTMYKSTTWRHSRQ